MPQLALADTTLSYVQHGDGRPLLLIHGSLCDHRYWAPQYAPLSSAARVIGLSLRHYWPERWDGRGEGFSIEQHAGDVAAFIEAYGHGPVDLCGHSRGGLVALRVAMRFPRLIRRLVLAEPGGRIGAPGTAPESRSAVAAALPAIAARIAAGDIDGGLEQFLMLVDGPRGWLRTPAPFKQMARDNAHTLLGQAREPATWLDPDELRELVLPTLLMGGERSPPLFAGNLQRLAELLPQARRVTIARAAHPLNVENATLFNRELQAFLTAPPG